MKTKLIVNIGLVALCSAAAWSLFAQDTDFDNSPEERQATLAELTQQLHELESTYNAFNPAIGEIAFDIGNLQLAQGAFEDALVSFRRYMYISRINQGLDTEKQIPALEKIIETNYQIGDLAAAGQALVQLHSMFDQSIASIQNNVDELITKGQWHLDLVDTSLSDYKTYHLFLAYSAFKRATEIRLVNQHIYNPALFTTLCSINYKMAELAQEDRDILSSTQGISSYKEGVKLLENALSFTEDMPDPNSKIDVLMQLGDWNKRFNKIRGAKDYYLQAYAQTKALPPTHPFYSAFDEPQIAQDFELPKRNTDVEDSLSYHQVTVSLDVSKWGDAYRTDIIEDALSEDQLNNSKLKRAAKRKGNGLTFRPKIIDGELVATKDLIQTIDVAVPQTSR